MAAKIGGFLGLLAGFVVWKMIGGVIGFFVAVLLVVPIASALFIGLFSAMGGGGKGTNAIEPQGLGLTTTTKTDQQKE